MSQETTTNEGITCAACGRDLTGKRVHEFNGARYGGRCIYKVKGTGGSVKEAIPDREQGGAQPSA